MFKYTLLLIALAITIGVSVWGVVDTQGLSSKDTASDRKHRNGNPDREA